MTLLTKGDYRAISASQDLPGIAHIDGGFRPAISGAPFETVNPATGG